MAARDIVRWLGQLARRLYRNVGSGDGQGSGGHGGTSRTMDDGLSGPAGGEGKFGRMFPDLSPHNATKASLERLADVMRDVGNATSSDTSVPAGYTYLGQFIDHDVTLDTTPISDVQVDPSSLINFRTPKLELDCVYGAGPEVDNFLYESGTGPKLVLGVTDAGRSLDLPRMPNGIAVIGDKRNDENLAVSQLQFAWLRFHNAVVDHLHANDPSLSNGEVFAEARELTIWHYQWIVIHDFLRRIIREDVLDDVLNDGRQFYLPAENTFMPVEFAVAAYRMGHSMVRNNYDWNLNFPNATLEQLFQFSGLSGNIVTQSDIWIADWRRMFDIVPPSGFTINATRKLDPLLAEELHTLPGGGGSLPARNLLRGLSLGLPSGQAIAREMGLLEADILQTADFSGADGEVAVAEGFDAATPLWYYVLKEAEVKENGNTLGIVGSRIVAEVFVGMLQLDPMSFLAQQPDWIPTLPSATPDHFTMADMFRFANNVNPVENG